MMLNPSAGKDSERADSLSSFELKQKIFMCNSERMGRVYTEV